MKTILLVIALVAKADAPKAGLQEAAAAPAAVASEAVLPTGSFVKPSESVAGEVCDAKPSEKARANAPVIGAALLSEAGETTESVALDDIKVVKESAARLTGILPEPRSNSSCNLADLYGKRFLSGPWSVTRRLEAARKRGDSAAARHLEATLDALVTEAVGDGE